MKGGQEGEMEEKRKETKEGRIIFVVGKHITFKYNN